jgi:hypothetical protein
VQDDQRRVDLQFGSPLAQPDKATVDILDGGGEGPFRCQPIVHGDDDRAEFSRELGVPAMAHFEIAQDEPAAVYVKDGGRVRAPGWPVDAQTDALPVGCRAVIVLGGHAQVERRA